jgi:hypothetical protein
MKFVIHVLACTKKAFRVSNRESQLESKYVFFAIITHLHKMNSESTIWHGSGMQYVIIGHRVLIFAHKWFNQCAAVCLTSCNQYIDILRFNSHNCTYIIAHVLYGIFISCICMILSCNFDKIHLVQKISLWTLAAIPDWSHEMVNCHGELIISTFVDMGGYKGTTERISYK